MGKKEKGNEKAFPKTEDAAEAAGEAVGPTGGRAGEVVEHSEDWTDAAPDDGGAGIDGAAGGAADDAAGEAIAGAGSVKIIRNGPEHAEGSNDASLREIGADDASLGGTGAEEEAGQLTWPTLRFLASELAQASEHLVKYRSNMDNTPLREPFGTIADFFLEYPDAPMLSGIQQCRLKKMALPDDLANETPLGLFQLRVLHATVMAGLAYMKAQQGELAAKQAQPKPAPPQPHELRDEFTDAPFAATGFSGR